MKLFRSILNLPMTNGSRFNRYYSGVLGKGEGYPTADEARRDLREQELQRAMVGWLR